MNRTPPFLRLLAGGLIAVAVLTGVFALKGAGQPEPLPSVDASSPTPSPSPTPVVSRLLVQVTDDTLRTVDTVLLARDGSTLRAVTMDPQLVFDFGQVGLQTLSSAGPIVPVPQMQDVVQRNTGLQVDAVLTLQRLALAGLVDSVGGITVTVDKPLQVGSDPANPEWVGTGRQVLAGAVAADYALYRGPRELESARTDRFARVISAVMSALPRDAASTRSVVAALGSTARSSIPTPAIGDFLVGLNQEGLWDGVTWQAEPTAASQLQRLPGSTWLRVDIAEAQDVALEVGPAPRAGPLRVVVEGGTAAQRLKMRDTLRESGYIFIDGGWSSAVGSAVSISKSLPSFGTRDFVVMLGLKVTGVATIMERQFGDIHVTIGTSAERL